jgi:hypothetical protein
MVTSETGPDGVITMVSMRIWNGSEYKEHIRKLATLEEAGQMSAMVISERHFPKDARNIPDPNCQGMQDTQDTQGTQGTQGIQGMQDELQTSTQLRRSK